MFDFSIEISRHVFLLPSNGCLSGTWIKTFFDPVTYPCLLVCDCNNPMVMNVK